MVDALGVGQEPVDEGLGEADAVVGGRDLGPAVGQQAPQLAVLHDQAGARQDAHHGAVNAGDLYGL